jgi:hypothetical protein
MVAAKSCGVGSSNKAPSSRGGKALERVRRKTAQFDRFGGMAVECRKATLGEGGIAVAHSGDLGKLRETSEFY